MPGDPLSSCLFCLVPARKRLKRYSDAAGEKDGSEAAVIVERLLSRFGKQSVVEDKGEGAVSKSAAFRSVLSEAFVCSVCKKVYDNLFGVYLQYQRLEREIEVLVADLKNRVVSSSSSSERRCSADGDTDISYRRDSNVRRFRRSVLSSEEESVDAAGKLQSNTADYNNLGRDAEDDVADYNSDADDADRLLYSEDAVDGSYVRDDDNMGDPSGGEIDQDDFDDLIITPGPLKKGKGMTEEPVSDFDEGDGMKFVRIDSLTKVKVEVDLDLEQEQEQEEDNLNYTSFPTDSNPYYFSTSGPLSKKKLKVPVVLLEKLDLATLNHYGNGSALFDRTETESPVELQRKSDTRKSGRKRKLVKPFRIPEQTKKIRINKSSQESKSEAKSIPVPCPEVPKVKYRKWKKFPCPYCSTKPKKDWVLRLHIYGHHKEHYLKDYPPKSKEVTEVIEEVPVQASEPPPDEPPPDEPISDDEPDDTSPNSDSEDEDYVDETLIYPKKRGRGRGNAVQVGGKTSDAVGGSGGSGPKKGFYSCAICDKQFKRDWEVILHLHKAHRQRRSANLYLLKFAYKKGKQLKERVKSDKDSDEEVEYEEVDADQVSDEECDNPRDKDYVVPLSIKEQRRNKVKPEKPVGPFTCDVCGRVYNSLGSFNTHISKTHQKVLSFVCPICDKKFVEKSGMIHHVIVVHEQTAESKPLNCSTCEKAFCNEVLLKRHEGYHKYDDSKPLACDVCDIRYKVGEEALLEKHKTLKHEKTRPVDNSYPCEFCGKMLKSHKQYLIHVAKKHRDQSNFPCSNCPLRYPAADLLTTHERTHSVDLAVFHCLICNAHLKAGEFLAKHMLKHFFIVECPAEGCGTFLYSQGELERHQVRAHGAEPPCPCSYCGKRFMTMNELSGHKERIHEVVPFKFKCTLCDRGFAYKGALTTHYSRDHLKKRFVCEVCGKAVVSRLSLRNHMNIHTGIKPYDCPQCGVKLSSSYGLQRHVQTLHAGGEKHFVCEKCGLSFTQSSKFKRHIDKCDVGGDVSSWSSS